MPSSISIQSHKGIYEARFAPDLLNDPSVLLEGEPHFIVDSNIARLYSKQLHNVLSHPNVILVDATEQNKSLESASQIITELVDYDVEDNAYAIMRTSNGVVAMLNSSATQWRHQFSLDINLQKGSIILRGILSGSKSYGSETMTTVFANPDRDNGDPKESTQEYSFDPSWTAEIDAFADVVRNNLPIESGTSHDALMTMQLVHKIYYADQKWRDTYSIPNPDFTI